MIERFESNGKYSGVVRVDNQTIYLAGMVASDFDGDISKQTMETLSKIENLLDQYGSDINNVITATVYLKDMADFKAFGTVWNQVFSADSLPARTTVQAAMVNQSILVEVTVIAAVK